VVFEAICIELQIKSELFVAEEVIWICQVD